MTRVLTPISSTTSVRQSHMTSEQTKPSADTVATQRGTRTPGSAVWAIVALAVLAVIAYYARIGAVSDRIRNPQVSGAPRPVQYLFGLSSPTWLTIIQIGTVVAMLLVIAAFAIAWRRHPAHPTLLMAIVTTLIVWQDPLMNWAPYAVYNPQLWHWPEDWPLVSVSPTVETFIVFVY